MESYNYAEQKKRLCTEENVHMLLKVRDKAKRLINTAGAFTVERLMSDMTGESWLMLAAIEFLAERKEIELVSGQSISQYSVYK